MNSLTLKPAVQSGRSSGFNPPIRLRILAVFFFTLALTIIAVAYFAIQAARSELLVELKSNLEERARARAATISSQLQFEIVQPLIVFAANDLFQDRLEAINELDPGAVQAEMSSSELQWAAAADSDPLVQGVLDNVQAAELREYQSEFPGNAEIFVTDKYGGLIAATDRTSDFFQADETWWQQAYNNGAGAVYIGQPELDESTQTLGVIAAIPIYGEGQSEGEVVGIIRTTFMLTKIADIVSAFRLGETGSADMIFPDGMMVSGRSGYQRASAETVELLSTTDGIAAFEGSIEGNDSLISIIRLADVADDPYISGLGWTLMVHQDTAESLHAIQLAINSVTVTGVIALVVSSIFAIVAANFILNPINRLARAARSLASGDFNVRAEVFSRDEIGRLYTDFNVMAEQIQSLVTTLETRITARTRDLEAVADVNKQISTILNVERLLEDVTDITKERFKLYHAHIYLLDEDGDRLLLAAGAGHVGRQMVLRGHAINAGNLRSIVASAARSRGVVAVNDVTQTPDFLPNPLLPDTRSELAVALVARGQLIGVLDVQSDQTDTFDDDLQSVIQLLAGQIAIALSNARLFEQTERSSRHERAIGTINRRIQDAVDMDEILQTAVRELGKALRVPHTALELRIPSDDRTPAGDFSSADSSAD